MKNDQREKRRKIIMEGNRGKPKSNHFRKLFVLLFAKFLTLFYAALLFFFIALMPPAQFQANGSFQQFASSFPDLF